MKPASPIALLLVAALPFSVLAAAEQVVVIVAHDLVIARPSETITVLWSEVSQALPGALSRRIAVKDRAGRVLPYQFANVAAQAEDPKGVGNAFGDLIFQYDFAVGERSATFTIEKIDTDTPMIPSKVFARYVPERLDDFAWENDRVAHRTYGPALGAPDEPKTGKEVLVASGLDVWCKRVPYLIVDRWYNKGDYHNDEGEGLDLYQVGGSRGCGGTGIWDGQKLAVSRNYKSWKVITNGPIRAIFELAYDTWDANGVSVAEVKRFTVDAGHNLDQIESTFTVVSGEACELIVAVGLNKTPTDRGQNPILEITQDRDAGAVTQWVAQKTNGELGTAVVVPLAAFQGFAEDAANLLVLAKATPGQPLRYLAGAGWSRSGQFSSKAEWHAYVTAAAARAKSPVRVTIATE